MLISLFARLVSFFTLLFHRPPRKTSPPPQTLAAAASRPANADRPRISTAGSSGNERGRCGGHVYCSICMENKKPLECIFMRGCAHVYCARCVRRYVAAKLEVNVTSIGCPEPECRAGRLEPDMCRQILEAGTLQHWANRLREEGIPRSERFYCPYTNCGALLIRKEVRKGRAEVVKAACPRCKRLVCWQCRTAWHRWLSCKLNMKRVEEELAEKQLLDLARKMKWKQCPGCGFLIEKISGCHQIQCRCKRIFCYG